ncbi:MAG: site-2 protease family protein [Pirellulaceae bacterium]|nr:site-2 protease family protein [Pirellulaceae bacterium]
MLDSVLFIDSVSTSMPWLLATSSNAEYLAAWGATLWNILRVAIGLGFVIFVHELGHFLAAKFFGVKCEKFYVGFDVPISLGPIRLPAKLFHFQWGETEYGIGSIPLGGYVKMLGQDDDPRNAEKENERIRVAGNDQVEAVGRAQYDPRSFPAKSVFARMVIISAGVVMNIIFGILFAAIAYKIGVSYEPTIIGDVVAGDPAWQAGLQSGDQIVQIAEMKAPNANLSFRDMNESIALAGFDHPKEPIPVLVDRAGATVPFSIVGTTRHDPKNQMLRIGISSPLVTRISDKSPFMPLMSENWPEAESTLPKFEPGDTIVGVNGTTLPTVEGIDAPLERELDQFLNPLFDQTVTVQVERKSKDPKGPSERVEVTWKPLPMRTLGIGFQTGPVAAIQVASAAERAGVAVGDTILSFDGQPIENVFALPSMVAKKKGEKVTLTLKRSTQSSPALSSSTVDDTSDAKNVTKKDVEEEAERSKRDESKADSEEYSFEWTVPETFFIRDIGMQYNPVGLELPGAGLVVKPEATVSTIKPNQKDATEGMTLVPGDKILQIRLDVDADPSIQAVLKEAIGKETWNELVEGKKLEGGYSSQYLHSLVQHLPIGTKLRVYFYRDSKVEDLSVKVSNDPDLFNFDRGLLTQPAKRIHRANSMSEAANLGVVEIVNKGASVLRFLRMALSWKIPRNAAAGPAVIFYVATSAASEGTTKLLLFLTMLSANLAVLNFLPIPALDGGHMMFLIAEAIRGKPVDEALQMRLTVAGVLALLALMLFVTFNDVENLFRIFG